MKKIIIEVPSIDIDSYTETLLAGFQQVVKVLTVGERDARVRSFTNKEVNIAPYRGGFVKCWNNYDLMTSWYKEYFHTYNVPHDSLRVLVKVVEETISKLEPAHVETGVRDKLMLIRSGLYSQLGDDLEAMTL